MKDFHTKKIKEIKLWAWAAAVLPITFLAGLFLIEIFGLDTFYHKAIVSGGVVMFAMSVIWWWWALHTIGSVTHILGRTLEKFKNVNKELDSIKKDIKDL